MSEARFVYFPLGHFAVGMRSLLSARLAHFDISLAIYVRTWLVEPQLWVY